MSEKIKKPGKLQPSTLKSLVFSKLGEKTRKIILEPEIGHDFNAIQLVGDQVLLATTDPLYVNRIFDIEDAAWLGFQIILSDFLVSGLLPQYAIFSLNLPNNIEESEFEQIWNIFNGECKRLGISIISGHTGRYDGCDFPIIGSATLIGTCNTKDFLNPNLLNPGNDILLVNGPGMEAVASLLRIDKARGKKIFQDTYREVRDLAWNSLSFEKPARIIQELIQTFKKKRHNCQVTAMHDVAEKGVLGAVNELCHGKGLGCNLNLDEWTFEKGINEYIDGYFHQPDAIWRASGQGGLLIACENKITATILDEMKKKGIKVDKIGTVMEKQHGRKYKLNLKENEIPRSIEDPFWPVFQEVASMMKNNKEMTK